ncbi:MAG: CHAT domain-containing protein [Blastocatellia bacterium]
MAKKIKILFLAANPVNVKSRLKLEQEYNQIREKLRASEERDAFKLRAEWAVTPDNLSYYLLTHKPHILHFSGHGSQSQGMALEDQLGNIFLLDTQAFAELLKIVKDNIRIVLLNACYTTDQARLLTETIDFTVGMNKPIGDRAASVFAAHFYQGLAHGRSVQEAFRLATVQLKEFKIPEADTPELLVRYGVDPNEIILVNKPPKAEGVRNHPTSSPTPEGGIRIKNKDTVIQGDQGGIINK